jgi:SNF family Na+-dependent transporter
MVGEIAIGRAAGTDAYGAYTKLGGKKWGLLGLFGVISGILILSYYNVVAGWAFGYFIEITFGNLLQEKDYRGFFRLVCQQRKSQPDLLTGFSVTHSVGGSARYSKRN